MLVGEFTKRVRYAETDKMGYLYYGHYAKYYEIGRAELIREIGLSYKEMEESLHIMMPVLQLECRFRLPAYYDDLLKIRTKIPYMPTKMIQFDQEIVNEKGKLLNTGTVKLFFVDMKNGKRTSCPDYLKDQMIKYY